MRSDRDFIQSAGEPELEAAEIHSVLTQEQGSSNVEVSANRPEKWIEPDLSFIDAISQLAGCSFKVCYQCGTCSASCPITPETNAFPRKEMAWAAWGLKENLIGDPDVWLCHQCGDCSMRCPRGGRPGDVLAGVRMETIGYCSLPQFMTRWMRRPFGLVLLITSVALLLYGLGLLGPHLGRLLGFSAEAGESIVYSYWSRYPHWMLNLFFVAVCIPVIAVLSIGVRRLWQEMKKHDQAFGPLKPTRSLTESFLIALRKIMLHDRFALCLAQRGRMLPHLALVLGFLALSMVTLWVITGPINPLLPKDGFVYPLSFWNPWKLLANLGGIAVVIGCLVLVWNRLAGQRDSEVSNSSDWVLLGIILAVVLTGFISEGLHYLRMVPHRYVAYFLHLVLASSLLIYLPYSKLAHVVYRTAAMVYTEYVGRYERGEHKMIEFPPSEGGERKSPEAEQGGEPESVH